MNIFEKAVNYILPGSCHVCRKLGVSHEKLPFYMPENLNLCEDCLSKLVPVDKDRRWIPCLSEPFDGDPYPGLPLYMPFSYDEFFKVAIPVIKFKQNKELAQFIGSLLGSIAAKDGICADVIIPIPLSRTRLEERGFNQAEVIGLECARRLNISLESSVLRRVKNTRRQTELGDNIQRSANIAGAFEVTNSERITGKTVILLDDVATTGQTLHEASCELLNCGASKVLCMAVCGNRSVKNADPF